MHASVKGNDDSTLLVSGLAIGMTSLFLLLAGTMYGQPVGSYDGKGSVNNTNLWINEANDNNARSHSGPSSGNAPSAGTAIHLEAAAFLGSGSPVLS